VIRRPWSVLAAAGTAAHHGFELRAGVGLVFEPWLGRRGALAAWGVALPLWAVVAAAGGPRWDRAVALWNGSALAGGLVHYAMWPWAVRRGVPTLTEAEGLRAEHVPAYDAILKAWVAAAAAALARETGPGAWRYALAGLAQFEPLRRSARHHFAWAREQARRDPAHWSPALAPSGVFDLPLNYS
jgi:hypothetical protein